MLTVNKISFTMPANNVQAGINQNLPKLKTLNQDTVFFSGLFSKKPPEPKHVTKEAYEVVTKYIDNNSGNDSASNAVYFLKKIKSICEEGLQLHLDEEAYCAAQDVEKTRVSEVGNLLMKIKSSVLPTSHDKGVIIQSMDEYKGLLGKLSN